MFSRERVSGFTYSIGNLRDSLPQNAGGVNKQSSLWFTSVQYAENGEKKEGFSRESFKGKE